MVTEKGLLLETVVGHVVKVVVGRVEEDERDQRRGGSPCRPKGGDLSTFQETKIKYQGGGSLSCKNRSARVDGLVSN